MKIFSFLIIFIIFCLSNEINCWDNTEMQMFDLVEEVNENFYGYLGVDQNATNGDIRRAYRKLSLLYHPDRNPNPDDTLKFRRLVAIYEILKDDNMREKYNDVLKFGLPDWKMPAYYFRKLRKMSFIETFLLFSILATVIHYACLWGVYFEHKLNMDDYLSRRKRKRNNESEMNKQLNTEYKPQLKDILPIILVKFLFNFLMSTPHNIKSIYYLVKEMTTTAINKKFEQKIKDKEKEEEKKMIEEIKKQKKERKQVLTKEITEKRKIYETGIQNAMTLPIETFSDIPMSHPPEKDDFDGLILGPWTDKETVALIKALSKFPAGVNDRWIKISDFVRRPVNEVTKKVKEIQASSKEGKVPINSKMQNSLGDGVEEQFDVNVARVSPSTDDQNIQKSNSQKMLSAMPATKVNDQVPPIPVKGVDNQNENLIESQTNVRKKPLTKGKQNGAPEPSDNAPWNQNEQKQLEIALRTFPKGTADRWDRISDMVPTKTKMECIERIKKLSQSIQEKTIKSTPS